MGNVILNTFKLLIKRKSFITVSIIIPAICTILFSYVNGQSMVEKVGIVDNDNGEMSYRIKEKLEKIEGIKLENLKEEEVQNLLASRDVELVIIINKNYTEDIINGKEPKIVIKKAKVSEISEMVKSTINSENKILYSLSEMSHNNIEKFRILEKEYKDNIPNYSLSKREENKISVMHSIGIIIMIIFISGQTITRFIIQDEKGGTQNRILLSKVSKQKYYASMLIVFYICSSLTSIIYYIMCLAFRFDFGMDNSLYFLAALLLTNLVAVAFNLCIVSGIKSLSVASGVSILFIVPTSMLSGAYWDFELMPEFMQRIGGLCPQRWAMDIIEKFQRGYGIKQAMPLIMAMILLSIVLFMLSLFWVNRRNLDNVG